MGFQVAVRLGTLQEASYITQNEKISISDFTNSVLQIPGRNVLHINKRRRDARGDGLAELLVCH